MEMFITIYATIAITTCLMGLGYKFFRYACAYQAMERELNPRTTTPYPAEKKSLLASLVRINVYTYTKFWMRANPVTFIGHVLYHLGLFTGLIVYTVIIAFIITRGVHLNFSDWITYVCDWFSHEEEIFGATNPGSTTGKVLNGFFFFALLNGLVGMSIPFIMSFAKKRGMTRPLDNVLKEAGIHTTSGLPSKKRGYSRKVIGIAVLTMDSAMLISFLVAQISEYGCIIHVLFALTILAFLPFNFLFHEIYRLRMWGAVKRVRDGRI